MTTLAVVEARPGGVVTIYGERLGTLLRGRVSSLAMVPAGVVIPETEREAAELILRRAGVTLWSPPETRLPDPLPEHPHPHHDNARRALVSLVHERRLPLPVEELLRHAYQLGAGDPWAGYLELKPATERELGTAGDPAAVLRVRLWRVHEGRDAL